MAVATSKKKQKEKASSEEKPLKFMGFNIHIQNEIIRSKSIDCVTFYVYCKLIQRYYVEKSRNPEKSSNTVEFNHKKLMQFCDIGDNRRFKKCLDLLYEKKLINTQIKVFPKQGTIQIELNTYFDKKKREKENKKVHQYYFARLPVEILDSRILKIIGHTGIRLLFYYESYTRNNVLEAFAFTSLDTISKETGLSRNTIIKYNEILRKSKLLRIDKHKLEGTGAYVTNEFGDERAEFTKYNNHYRVDIYGIETIMKKQMDALI